MNVRNTPRLPNHVADPAPSTAMYWSRAPVFGHLPDRAMRGHSLTPIDNIVWQIGGCDANGACFKDILTFNTGAFPYPPQRVPRLKMKMSRFRHDAMVSSRDNR